MSKIWVQSLKGRAIDLLDVDAKAVDFQELCEQLAQINHHYGAANIPVSAAIHAMIAADCADEGVLPWVLVSGMHEARTLTIGHQARLALAEIAGELGGHYSEGVRFSIDEFIRRHEAAIFTAAGLAMPTHNQRQKIAAADLRAIATERRDFLADSPKRWTYEIESAAASSKVYRLNSFGKCAFDVAQALYKRLEACLPALGRPKVA